MLRSFGIETAIYEQPRASCWAAPRGQEIDSYPFRDRNGGSILLGRNPLDVLTGPGIDPNHVTDVDEQRGEDLCTGFEPNRLGHVCSCIAPSPRLAILDLEFDVGWRGHANRLAVEKHHLARHAFFQVNVRVLDLVLFEFVLFVRLIVHENEGISLAVEILDGNFLHIGGFQRVSPFKNPVKRGAADQIFQFALVQGVPLARFAEIHFRHQIRFAVNLDFDSLLEVAGLISRHVRSLLTH